MAPISRSRMALERLLYRCESLVLEERIESIGEKFRFKALVHKLRQLLEQVEQESYPSRNDAPAQESSNSWTYEYLRKIQQLADLVDDSVLLSPAERGLSSSHNCDDIFGGKGRETQIKYAEKARERQREFLLSAPNSPTEAEQLFAGQTSRPSSVAEGKDGEDELFQQERKLHDDFTGEMVNLAQNLKINARAIGDVAREDQKKLGTTVSQMTSQQHRFKKLNDKLKELSEKYGSMCLLQICSILTVLTVFMLTFMFMRLFPKRAVKIVANQGMHDFDDDGYDLEEL